MKKHFVILIAALAMMAGFSSCSSDPDEERAIALSGEWEGDWGMWYEDEFGYTYDAICTYIQLIPDYTYATHGIGYQEDYYDRDITGRRRSYFRFIWYKFDWEIRNGIIYLRYYDDHPFNINTPTLNTYIRDYRLSNNRFSGYFGRSNSTFYMGKISDFYHWERNFPNGIYFGYYVYDYYSKPYEGATRSNTGEKAPAIVKYDSHMRQAAE